jgi:hypothetical protein
VSELPVRLAADLAALRELDERDRPSAAFVVGNLRSSIRATDGPMPLVTNAAAQLASTVMTAWAATLLLGVIVVVVALHIPMAWYIERAQPMYWIWDAHDKFPTI